jgi:alkylhydroperoxidase family enzyme
MQPRKLRVRPLEESEWTDEIREVLPRSRSGRVLNIFTTLARHPKLLKRWLVFGSHVMVKSTLSPRARELLILRTGYRCKSEYEWGQHVQIARQVGITEEEILRITHGPDAPGWDELDALLLSAADELHDEFVMSDGTWNDLSKRFDVRQMMDVVFTVGQYTLVSMALNTLGVERDEGVVGFPE